jgi:uncharacterized protein YacL
VTAARRRAVLLVLTAAYLLGLAVLLLWPEHVDRGASGFFRRLAEWIPWATHARIELAANVVVFIPFGLLLALLLTGRRYLVLPLALLATTAVETIQAVLPDRTPSLQDILANVIGACVGLVLAELVSRPKRPNPGAQPAGNPRR